VSPEQSRAARGWLGWSQTELARRASVSLSTVRDFETGTRTPIANNIAAMRRAIEDAGMSLVFDETGKPTGIAFADTAG
jgi:predicted transcriptional regulator